MVGGVAGNRAECPEEGTSFLHGATSGLSGRPPAAIGLSNVKAQGEVCWFFRLFPKDSAD